MLITFNFTRIAIVVRRWFEITPDAAMEHGARVELHVLTPQPHRGTDSAAQKTVIDGAFWRADLFNRFGHPAASFSAAHYHPSFDGIEPSDRVWSTDLTTDPWTWLTKQLHAIDDRVYEAGIDPLLVADDADDIRTFVPQIVPTDPGRRRTCPPHGRSGQRPRHCQPRLRQALDRAALTASVHGRAVRLHHRQRSRRPRSSAVSEATWSHGEGEPDR